MIGNVKQPIIVQNDFTLLLETDHPEIEAIQASIGKFADLLKSPEHLYTYRITAISLWQAAEAGMRADAIIKLLTDYGKFGVPASVKEFIERMISRYGSLRLEQGETSILLIATEWQIIQEITQNAMIQAYCRSRIDPFTIAVDIVHRGDIKRELLRAGYPVVDAVGYQEGELLPTKEKEAGKVDLSRLKLRDYQLDAVNQFYQEGKNVGGSGVIVLPCGSGKTMVGLAAISRLRCATLILTSNVTSVKQWRRELLNKTNIEEDWIGEYTGTTKDVKPITIATYQILTYRRHKEGPLIHIGLFNEKQWGLIIYDEVHLLPAPVFRMTASIQATRRLGLTATLIREDGREEDVFALIGPKRYEQRWKVLEHSGWIAKAICIEVAVPMTIVERQRYLGASRSAKHRIAGENPLKIQIVQQIISEHMSSQIIIIGQYIKQLNDIARALQAPLITGKVPQHERELLYEQFINGDIQVLVVSKVANFAIDLPEANVAVQISGSYGSRQEEAQRLGRILRPKKEEQVASFYTLVSERTCEVELARHRQLFLVEQGYHYRHQSANDIDHQEMSQ